MQHTPPAPTPQAAVRQLRLARQALRAPGFAAPEEAVAWLGALQGQDYAGAKWSVGLRAPGSSDAAVEAALRAGTLARTWLMRGTLHLLATRDVPWMLALITPRLRVARARRARDLNLDATTLARGTDLLGGAVAAGPQDRAALLAVLRDHGLPTDAGRGLFVLQQASVEGLLVQGAAVRGVPRFRALREPAPVPPLPREEALARLATRYFGSRGPASVQDFAWWAGLSLADAHAGLSAAQVPLAPLDWEGQTLWTPAEPPPEPPPEPPAPDVLLLPGFDEYLLGYADRRAALDPQHARTLVPGGNGVFMNTIVSAGQVVGTWRRDADAGGVRVTPQPFRRLTDAERHGLTLAAAQYGAFLDAPVTLAG